MNAREKLNEYAEINGLEKNNLMGWSIVADFAEWYLEQYRLINNTCNGNCGMNYCDDNGCIERKRVLTEPKELPEN